VGEVKAIDRSLPVLDPTPIEEAFGEINEAAIGTYGLFLSSTEPILADIGKHLMAGDMVAAAQAAHSAKGAARMTGAFRLAELCSSIEQCGKQGDSVAALEWLAVVPTAFDEVRRAIRQVELGADCNHTES
jgi:two-component system sensor histidine kinase/response regulator